MKSKRAAPAPAGRPAPRKGRREGRAGGIRRASAGAPSPRTRTPAGHATAARRASVPDPYEAFHAGGEEGVGLLDPGFDEWDVDPYAVLGLAPPCPDGGEED